MSESKRSEWEPWELAATSVANGLWSSMTTEQIEELVDYPSEDGEDEDGRPTRTLWESLVSWVFTAMIGGRNEYVALLHKPPEDQRHARGER